MKHTKFLISLIVAVGITFASQAQAQAPSGYPNKPIRMILPLAVGSAVDVAARLLAQKMSANMGQSIVIENITGAAAPVMFSITMDCPILADIFCANNLAATSTALPTAKGKIMRIGLLG